MRGLLLGLSLLFSATLSGLDGYYFDDKLPLHSEDLFNPPSDDWEPLLIKPVAGYEQNPSIEPKVWKKLQPYFLPTNHPLKSKLDAIFDKKKRVIKNINSLRKAGFKDPKIRKWTRLVVTTHDALKGYIIKLYTDEQHNHRGFPDWKFWVSRIEGAEIIRKTIEERNLGHIYTVPKKWIYPIPNKSLDKVGKYEKSFILIAEDMKILSDAELAAKWKSPMINEEFINTLFHFLEDLGFSDCAKPANIPFTRSGKMAFVDTQSRNRWPIAYHQLTHFLTPEMKAYLETLTPLMRQQ